MECLLILSIAALFLLASCQWNIGEHMCSASAVYVGADTRCPVDGKVYRIEGDRRAYIYAPKVTYQMRPDLFELRIMGETPRKPVNIKRTGRIIPVRVGGMKVERLEQMPAATKAVRTMKYDEKAYQGPFNHRKPGG